MVGVWGLLIMYTLVAFAPFVASQDYSAQNPNYSYCPPSPVTFRDADGKLGLRPHTYEMSTVLDPESFKVVFKINKDHKVPIQFFTHGDPYVLFGIDTDLHLFGVDSAYRIFPLGADRLGRDIMARILMGGRVSMTVGLLGVALTITIGSILGTASGYWGGILDDLIQRVVEFIMCFPTVPLWAALAAALPPISRDFTGIHRYFLITVILSLVNWTSLARQLRGKVMAYKGSEFVLAALAQGASDKRIIMLYMLPNALSHIIVVAALAIPNMILGETALSFLGLGILPPLVSWGALLQDAQNVMAVVAHPWLLTPGVAVILTVLFFSFLGDGLRDAFDPYSI